MLRSLVTACFSGEGPAVRFLGERLNGVSELICPRGRRLERGVRSTDGNDSVLRVVGGSMDESVTNVSLAAARKSRPESSASKFFDGDLEARGI